MDIVFKIIIGIVIFAFIGALGITNAHEQTKSDLSGFCENKGLEIVTVGNCELFEYIKVSCKSKTGEISKYDVACP